MWVAYPILGSSYNLNYIFLDCTSPSMGPFYNINVYLIWPTPSWGALQHELILNFLPYLWSCYNMDIYMNSYLTLDKSHYFNESYLSCYSEFHAQGNHQADKYQLTGLKTKHIIHKSDQLPGDFFLIGLNNKADFICLQWLKISFLLLSSAISCLYMI